MPESDRRPTNSDSGRRAFRVTVLLFLGTLLLQSAWILTLPPFRGTDEFDHAFRAAQVAGGDWSASHVAATDGRGNLVVVPGSLVKAAHAVCASYEYTGPDNCTAVRSVGHGNVEVASSASAYNPAFYFVVGTVGNAFSGDASLYAMRIAASVLCALFVAVAGWVMTLWARTVWPAVAMVVALTPVAGFSLSVVAPNGLEIAASLSLWMALLGLATARGRDHHASALLAVAGASALVVTTVRALGPLWVALIVLTAAGLAGWPAVRALARSRRVLLTGCVVLVSAATLGSVAWTHFSAAQQLPNFSTEMAELDLHPSTAGQVPLWFLQGIAAFPRRADAAPPLVYVLVGLVFLGLLVTGVVHGGRRIRIALLGCLLVSVAVPVAFTHATISTASPLWQGRYGIPFHMGVTLLAGMALEVRRGSADGPVRLPWVVGGVALAAANALSLVHVLDHEQRTSPLRDSTAWVTAPAWVIVVLVAAAFGAWAGAVGSTGPSGNDSRRELGGQEHS